MADLRQGDAATAATVLPTTRESQSVRMAAKMHVTCSPTSGHATVRSLAVLLWPRPKLELPYTSTFLMVLLTVTSTSQLFHHQRPMMEVLAMWENIWKIRGQLIGWRRVLNLRTWHRQTSLPTCWAKRPGRSRWGWSTGILCSQDRFVHYRQCYLFSTLFFFSLCSSSTPIHLKGKKEMCT